MSRLVMSSDAMMRLFAVLAPMFIHTVQSNVCVNRFDVLLSVQEIMLFHGNHTCAIGVCVCEM